MFVAHYINDYDYQNNVIRSSRYYDNNADYEIIYEFENIYKKDKLYQTIYFKKNYPINSKVVYTFNSVGLIESVKTEGSTEEFEYSFYDN